MLAYPFVTEQRERHLRVAGRRARARGASSRTRSTGPSPFLRTSLLPGLIEIAKRNLSRGLVDLELYEVGTVFLPAPDGTFGSVALPPGAALSAARTCCPA